jgi:hypothetical protein
LIEDIIKKRYGKGYGTLDIPMFSKNNKIYLPEYENPEILEILGGSIQR